MKDFFRKIIPARRDAVMLAVLLILSGVLFFTNLLPAGNPEEGTKEKAVVLAVDNSNITEYASLYRGSQILEVRVLSGKYKNKVFRASNELRAQMELDKLFKVNDIVLVGIMHGANPETDTVNAQDHYRISNTFWLFGLFVLLLVCFGGFTGICALLSFVFSCLVIWKLVIPLTLAGYNAILISLAAVLLLSVVIILLVAGLSRKGFAALAGAFAGVLAAAFTGWFFTGLFKINGAVMPYAQSLLNSGYEYLKLSDIFIGAIFLSSSGAVMDLAMDVASGIEEISLHNPALKFKDLFKSGIRIGRSVVGTMTTTLLLAYSGGYLTLMMMFAAQGTGPVDFINNPYVASETVKTLVGSFGLVLVAPLTAFVSALIFSREKNSRN